jgi:hypothetical protein
MYALRVVRSAALPNAIQGVMAANMLLSLIKQKSDRAQKRLFVD